MGENEWTFDQDHVSSKGCCLEPWRMMYRAPQTLSIQNLLRWASWKKGSKRLFRGFVGDNILPSYKHKPWTIRISWFKEIRIKWNVSEFFFWGVLTWIMSCVNRFGWLYSAWKQKNVSDSAQTRRFPPHLQNVYWYNVAELKGSYTNEV